MSIKRIASVLRLPSTQAYSLKALFMSQLAHFSHFIWLSYRSIPIMLAANAKCEAIVLRCPIVLLSLRIKVKWDLNNFVRRLSTSVVELSEFGMKKGYGEEQLGKTARVCAEYITAQAGNLVDFGDV